ncbi:metallophosphoesterase family protein [Paenibacillus hexagrammi]|uniref:Metallophosphatase family protein n=1 Tax=Paenibacillus hexagrammi TaxID=2908839 RepID=A0ABY3SFE1_9BACL|nr:metallophosphoesterase family protein [Paenibacillus sp. YPD9-1]UJF31632.1 metallophosphatase family protein [Paenibacillus sp. YPD9-1]
MDKIAIISDIHGNVPALEAVLNDIKEREIRRIVCLGDLVGKGPGSAEAVDRLREVCETIVQGNWDLGITYKQDTAGGIWQQEMLGSERLAYLAGLPFSVDIPVSGRLLRLFHASSTSIFHRVKRKSPKEERLALFRNTEATGYASAPYTPDIVGYGDIHVSFMLTMKNPHQAAIAGSDAPEEGLVLFNTGSVGCPYDGIPQACYTVMEGRFDAELSRDKRSGFAVQFVRVPYDIPRAVRLAYEADMPGARRYELEITTAAVHKELDELG